MVKFEFETVTFKALVVASAYEAAIARTSALSSATVAVAETLNGASAKSTAYVTAAPLSGLTVASSQLTYASPGFELTALTTPKKLIEDSVSGS